MLAGRATNEPLTVGVPPEGRRFGAGDSFSFSGDRIHRIDHVEGAVTVHVYSPPIRSIGHYELVDGELRREAGSPDEVSPPSPLLSAALMQQ